jgi:uncharacterized integral membrane protein
VAAADIVVEASFLVVHVRADTMDNSLMVEVEMLESFELPVMTSLMTMHYYFRSFHSQLSFVKHLFENSDNLLSFATAVVAMV